MILICGFGRHGKRIAKELEKLGLEFIAIDKDPKAAEGYENVLVGDAKNEDILKRADIKNAESLIVAVDNDADAMLITLVARSLNEKINIVAKADNLESVEKLEKVGANWVITPYIVAGKLLAKFAVSPMAASFLDTLMLGNEYEIDQVKVEKSDKRTLREINLTKYCVFVLGVYRGSELFISPKADFKLQKDDILVIVGKRENINTIRNII